MKKIKLLAVTAVAASFLASCGNKISPIYRTPEEWAKSYKILKVEDYKDNNELSNIPDGATFAKCNNGTFVATKDEEVNVWRGVPYAKQIGVGNRFEKAADPETSNKIYEAYYFGKACLQKPTENEPASLYKLGEDCLRLNVWNNPADKSTNKPVLVYIHGGGWNSGGTCDPLYNGYYFAHYNPGVIVVTITYRFNMLGLVNLGAKKIDPTDGTEKPYFTDYSDNYKYSVNNAIWDQVQALKYIHDNIASFGGDPNNITVSGESAGGGAVSILCTIPEARKYFQKAFAMSGSVNQISAEDTSIPLIDAIQAKDDSVEFSGQTWAGYNTIAELKNLPEGLLQAFIDKNQTKYQHPIRGLGGIAVDPFKNYEDGDTKDIIMLQGHTTNEFRYYQHVFSEYEPMYDAICYSMQNMHAMNGGDHYRGAWNNYKATLENLGYTEKEILRMYADDFTFSTAIDYQAEMHAKNGGKGYCYIFDKGYDGVLEYLGAAHAIDCFYLFGAFNGDGGLGSNEEVDLACTFQSMVANFCKSGNPSTGKLKWEPYTSATRKRMVVNFNCRLETNPDGERVQKALNLFNAYEGHEAIFRYTKPLGPIINLVAQDNFEVFRAWSQIATGVDPLFPPVDGYQASIVGKGIKFDGKTEGQPIDLTADAAGYCNITLVSTANPKNPIVINAVANSFSGLELYYGAYTWYYPEASSDDYTTIDFKIPYDLLVDDIVIYATEVA